MYLNKHDVAAIAARKQIDKVETFEIGSRAGCRSGWEYDPATDTIVEYLPRYSNPPMGERKIIYQGVRHLIETADVTIGGGVNIRPEASRVLGGAPREENIYQVVWGFARTDSVVGVVESYLDLDAAKERAAQERRQNDNPACDYWVEETD